MDVVRALLAGGALIDLWAKGDCDCQIPSRWGSWTQPRTSALHASMCHNRGTREANCMATLLLSQGARKLMWYQDSGQTEAWTQMMAVNSAGGAPSVLHTFKMTPLHAAAAMQMSPSVMLHVLDRYGAKVSVNDRDAEGCTALHHACASPFPAKDHPPSCST